MFFTNLQPVIDTVPGTLTVNATNAANTINYTEGLDTTLTLNPAFGAVSVDNFESMNFTNKSDLIINGLGGNDTINLNDPFFTSGLKAIGVSGGQVGGVANGNATVVVSAELPGAGPGANTVVVAYQIGNPVIPGFVSTPPTTDEATVSNAQFVPVEIDQAASLVIDGRSLGNSLEIASASTPVLNVVTLTPGADRDSGTINANRVDGASELPVSYLHLGGDIVAPVQIAPEPPATVPPETANKILVIGANTLVYNGTSANDTFEVGPTGDVTLVSTPNTGALAQRTPSRTSLLRPP